MGAPQSAPDRGRTTSLYRDGVSRGISSSANDARGHTNGRVDRPGRTNGLTNGMGRTNGLTNGLSDGRRGRTNGLTNGVRSRTREVGYVNGLRLRSNQFGIVYPSDVRRTRVLIAASIVLVLVAGLYLGTEVPAPSPFQIDGTFSEWVGVPQYPDPTDAIPSTADLLAFAVHPEPADVLAYARTRGPVFEGSEPSVVFLFVDAPSPEGYSVFGMDAEYVVETWGWNSTLEGVRFWAWSGGPDHDNASALEGQSGVSAASAGNEVEWRLPRWLLSASSDEDLRFRVATWSGGWTDAGLIAEEQPGAVEVSQRPLTDHVTTTTAVLEARFRAAASDVTIQGLTIDHVGGGTVELPAFPIVVSAGQERTAYLQLDPTAMAPGDLASLRITEVDAVAANETRSVPATVSGSGARVYRDATPSGFRVDGLFSDWTNTTPDPDESLPVSAEILATASALPGDGFFYVQTEGDLLAGAVLPHAPRKPVPSPPGNATPPVVRPLPRVAAEDLLRIYVDVDDRDTAGFSVGGIRADRLLEARGRNDRVTSRELFAWNASARVWDRASDLPPIALEGPQLEAQMPASFLGLTHNPRVVFETTDWSGANDLTDLASLLPPSLLSASVEPLHGPNSESVTASALTNTPTVDGTCRTTVAEYDGASVVVTPELTFYVGRRDDTQFVYVCVEATADTTENKFDIAWIMFDARHDGGALPRTDDRRFSVEHTQKFLTEAGTGAGWASCGTACDPNDLGANTFAGFERYEFRVRYADAWGTNAPAPGAQAGFAIVVQERGSYTFYRWGSSSVNEKVPDTWGQLLFPIPEFEVPAVAVVVLAGVLWFRRRRRQPR